MAVAHDLGKAVVADRQGGLRSRHGAFPTTQPPGSTPRLGLPVGLGLRHTTRRRCRTLQRYIWRCRISARPPGRLLEFVDAHDPPADAATPSAAPTEELLDLIHADYQGRYQTSTGDDGPAAATTEVTDPHTDTSQVGCRSPVGPARPRGGRATDSDAGAHSWSRPLQRQRARLLWPALVACINPSVHPTATVSAAVAISGGGSHDAVPPKTSVRPAAAERLQRWLRCRRPWRPRRLAVNYGARAVPMSPRDTQPAGFRWSQSPTTT